MSADTVMAADAALGEPPHAPVAEALAEVLAETLFSDMPAQKRERNNMHQTKTNTNKSKKQKQ